MEAEDHSCIALTNGERYNGSTLQKFVMPTEELSRAVIICLQLVFSVAGCPLHERDEWKHSQFYYYMQGLYNVAEYVHHLRNTLPAMPS